MIKKKLQSILCKILTTCFILMNTQCNESLTAEIPSYIEIVNFDYYGNLDSYDGYNTYPNEYQSTNITDAWVTMDGQALGVFELPCTIPILSDGLHTFTIYPGIKVNGIAGNRIKYPFYSKFETAKKIFEEADERLKFKISKIILNGPDSELKLTENTQPAILTVSYAIYSVLKKDLNFDFKECKYFAGHSLGEYSALVCSESLKFEDALYLLYERGKAMQEAVPVGKGSMLAILGAKIKDISDLLNSFKKKGVCEIANDNADGQVIVSGDKDSVVSFQSLLKEKKIKSIPLKVSAPFHCSLMKKAAANMEEKIKQTDFLKPKPNVISNVTAKPEEEVDAIKSLLVEQITSRVRWRESINYMINNKVDDFLEIGPGKVLSGLVKKINKEVKISNVNSIEDIKND